jgi:BirA family biotin operon repressor/biotin-[acetyl-CoA-carboxylase] ligase
MQKIKALNKNEIEKHYQAFSPLEITPKIHIFPELDSTNSYAKQFLKENPLESHGSIIIAEKQNAGRGRLGRSFASNTDEGLYISFILNTDNLPVPLITPYVSLALVRSIKSIWNIDAKIKWVNDVFIGTKKIAGILTEASFSSQEKGLSQVIVGIGINIFQKESCFPVELQAIAGSIYQALLDRASVSIDSENNKSEIDEDFLQFFFASKNIFTAQLIHNVFRILTQDIHKISENIAEYKAYSNILGKEVLVLQGDKSFLAKAVDINEEGHLIIEDALGKKQEILSGEVSIRLPTQ